MRPSRDDRMFPMVVSWNGTTTALGCRNYVQFSADRHRRMPRHAWASDCLLVRTVHSCVLRIVAGQRPSRLNASGLIVEGRSTLRVVRRLPARPHHVLARLRLRAGIRQPLTKAPLRFLNQRTFDQLFMLAVVPNL